MANSNPNVGFLRGTQDKVNTVLANQVAGNYSNNVVEGAFYITSDTNRMYIGKKDSSNHIVLASLNAGIVVVESYSDLPSQAEQGVFYYIKGKEGDTIANVLCIRSGEHWIQVNSINNVQKLTTDTDAIEGGAKVTTLIEDKIGNIKDYYTVKGKNGIGISNTYTKTKDGEDEYGLEIAAEQIQVAASAPNTSTATVSLNNSNLVDSTKKAFNIALASGNAGGVTASGNTITLTTQDTKVTDVSTTVADVTGGGVQITTDLTDTGNSNVNAGSFTVKGENLTVKADGDTGLKITAESIKVGTKYESTSKTATVSLASGLVDSSKNNFKLVAGDKVAFAHDSTTGAITINSTAIDTTNDSLTHELSTSGDVVTVKTTITDTANHPEEDSFTVTGSTGISVSSSGKAITITADDIALTTSNDSGKKTATATFTSGLMSNNKQELVFKGEDNVTLGKANDGAITIAAADTFNESLTFTKSTDDKGNAVNGFDVVLADSRGQSITGKFNPVVAYGHTGTGDNVRTTATANFLDGTASLDVYTAGEVDAIIEDEFRTFNAMEYQGVITALPDANSKIKNGYTYLVGDAGLTINGGKVSPGSLVIAKGTEGSDGYIPYNTITWDHITANLTDTLYELVAQTGGFEFKDNHNQSVGSFAVESGNDIVVSTGATSGNAQTLTIGHAPYNAIKTEVTNNDMGAVTSYIFNAIDSLTIKNGHIEGYTVTSHKVVDSVATVSKNEFSVSVVKDNDGNEENKVSVKNEVELTYDNGSKSAMHDSFTIASTNNNLIVSPSGKEVSLSLVWGTF